MSARPTGLRPEWRGRSLLQEQGEMRILEQIRSWLEERSHAASPDGFLALGVGDDAALARPRPGRQLVLTCDIHIEGRHFR
ncbi:MAG: hypothetical protein GF355_18125, partial [Candidatus Eisenbacteria bacterium]|nr:hypothetical protein [Candidatus Eisenbacteria bacterium]